VRVSALIKPLYTEDFEFLLSLTSNTEIYLDGVKILEVGETISDSVSLIAGKWYKLAVEFKKADNTGASASGFNLQW